MNKKKWYWLGILALGVMLIGCGKNNENNSESEIEKDSTIEDIELSEEENMTAKSSYHESLAAGKHICPDFPEVDRLAQVDEQYLLDSICPSVVRLESGNLFGSGIIWKMEEETIWIMTNQHMLVDETANVVENEDGLIDVIFWDGIRALGEIVEMSEEYDFGIVRVNLQDMGYYTVERYYQVRYDVDAYEAASPGDDIFVIGSADYPAGNLCYGTIGNRSIYMDSFGTEMLWAYCEVKAGMSGSGVFDEAGNLIGIVCAGNDQKEAAVLPIDKILAEWEESGY